MMQVALELHADFRAEVQRVKKRMDEQADALNSLPEEMMKMVLDAVEDDTDQYAARDSLKSLRLVNRKFAEATSPRVFRNVGLWIGINSIERLTKISEHPHCKSFRALHFQAYTVQVAIADKRPIVYVQSNALSVASGKLTRTCLDLIWLSRLRSPH